MPRTTLGLRTLRARPRTKDIVGGNDDVDGLPLMMHLGAYLHDRMSDPIRDDSKSRYLRVTEVHPRGRSITVVTKSGHYGEAGVTFHIETHEQTHSKSALEAATLETRTTFWAPPGAIDLVVAFEMKRGASHGGFLLDDFRRWMREHHDHFFFPSETVMEKEAWAASGELTEVSVVRHDRPLELSRGIDPDRTDERVLGRMVYTALPPKGQGAWPTRVWTGLRNGQIDAAAFLGLRRNDEASHTSPDESVYVTVRRDNRQKRFELGTDGVPSIREVLTDDGQDALDLRAYHAAVDSAVRAFYEDTDRGWSDAWVTASDADDWVAHRH